MGLFKKLFKGSGHTVEELARRLGTAPAELSAVRPTYTTFHIPKRSGGQRTIHAPAPELKQLQRLILRRVLARLRAHPHAVGFERGHSIVTNAVCHVGQPVVAKLDIVDFFASTSARRVEEYFQRIGWNREAAALLTELCTYNGGLPQGAPTSPRISNLVNFGIDAGLKTLAERSGATYTRYADDITFSFATDDSNTISMLLTVTRQILRDYGYRVHIARKRRIMRQHQRQEVTGLVVNRKAQLPRRTRRWLRAVRHRAQGESGPTLTQSQLQGWAALEHMITTQRDTR
ncbi:MAG: RNA-directed DNA polymerase [Candidatus Hydrogenedentes bacterium]|nr:RNA-directed DNA polymerase [Candidatus Hydrogenedentota bacterium]